jgi:hypothetical protein
MEDTKGRYDMAKFEDVILNIPEFAQIEVDVIMKSINDLIITYQKDPLKSSLLNRIFLYFANYI